MECSKAKQQRMIVEGWSMIINESEPIAKQDLLAFIQFSHPTNKNQQKRNPLNKTKYQVWVVLDMMA